MTASVTMLAFAGARDVIGAGEISLPLPSTCTADDLLSLVCRTYPALLPFRASLRIAINGSYVTSSALVHAGDEVALIPPVAGG